MYVCVCVYIDMYILLFLINGHFLETWEPKMKTGGGTEIKLPVVCAR